MSTVTHYQTLFAYHWHTTQRLIDGAGRLSEEAYHANPGYGHGSIHDLLFHLLRTDRSWRIAMETGQQRAGIQPAEFATLESIRAGFESEQAVWQPFLATLTDEAIGADRTLTNWRGEPWTFPLWRVLQHVVIHGMQHHTELAQLLTAQGQSPGDIDFLFYRG